MEEKIPELSPDGMKTQFLSGMPVVSSKEQDWPVVMSLKERDMR